MKNLKKSTGSMKKTDVYYKVDDIKSKEVVWSKVAAWAGSFDPKLKKEVKELGQTAKTTPSLKLGRVKSTLVLRVKEGSKHTGEWVLIENYVPPQELTGKDDVYAERLSTYIDQRESLLKSMTSLRDKVAKVGEKARYLGEAADHQFEGLETHVAQGETAEAQTLLNTLKTTVAELQQLEHGMDAIVQKSNTMQDDQRLWTPSKIQLDVADYNSRMDAWWQVVKAGQMIDSIRQEVAALSHEAVKLVPDAEKLTSGTALSQEETIAELNAMLDDMVQLQKKSAHWLDVIEKHRGHFLELEKELKGLPDEEDRQTRYEDEVPKRISNAEGNLERLKSNFAQAHSTAKRLKQLAKRNLGGPAKGIIDNVRAQMSMVVANCKSGAATVENLQDIAATLEALVG